jgi:hypothetical protein
MLHAAVGRTIATRNGIGGILSASLAVVTNSGNSLERPEFRHPAFLFFLI